MPTTTTKEAKREKKDSSQSGFKLAVCMRGQEKA
jgi:hypothetical protein